MKYTDTGVKDLRIAYIGGGSRGWAWGLMSDLATAPDISGEVSLYDIDFEAAKHNEIIGNKYNEADGARSQWSYRACETIEGALQGADFVVISILPGTFKEMESDVHAPEKYGIYQSVGDTVGPGGIIRALRTVPMFETIAKAIRDNCPDAWVINYTNPMTVCVQTLYRVFPGIKAFGCCHEVFGTQRLLAAMIEDVYGIKDVPRSDIRVNVIGVNHFTWLTEAKYRNYDLFEDYRVFARKYAETGFLKGKDENWMNNVFDCSQKVKFDLFLRYGLIAAAGDRHLAEFCEGKWYLRDPQAVRSWGFGLTPVSWRWKDLERRLEKSRRLREGEAKVELGVTGEDGVNQMRALLGLNSMVTNVNLPNRGQIPNLPMGAVVETNAVFSADSVKPVFAGEIPPSVYGLISRISAEQQTVTDGALARDLEAVFNAFANDPLVTVDREDARRLFDEMLENTKEYLGAYGL